MQFRKNASKGGREKKKKKTTRKYFSTHEPLAEGVFVIEKRHRSAAPLIECWYNSRH
jgi:hypothetical protein